MLLGFVSRLFYYSCDLQKFGTNLPVKNKILYISLP